MLDLNLPILAIGAATLVSIYRTKEEALTLIQSMYKTTVSKLLDTAYIKIVKIVASSPLYIRVAEFTKSIIDSLKINKYKEYLF
jgi:hypothetical protein